MNQILMNKNDDENNYIENLEKDTKKKKILKTCHKKVKIYFWIFQLFCFCTTFILYLSFTCIK